MTDDTLMKLQMHKHTMVIYFQYKFHENPSIGYLKLWLRTENKTFKFRQSKGNNSFITDDTQIKLNMNNQHTMVNYIQASKPIYIHIFFQVMAEDGKNH